MYVLDFHGFDLLLGMDWLEENEAILDCIKRMVLLKYREGRIIEVLYEEPNVLMGSFLYSLD